MTTFNESIASMLEIIQKAKSNFVPEVAIITGSGLGDLSKNIVHPVEIPYQSIPNFPKSTVPGHAGTLVLGELSGVPVICLKGRVHLYEGTSCHQFKLFIRLLKQLGCELIIMTNVAGSLNKEFKKGSLVLIKDHLNLFCGNPLIGLNEDEYGPRFFSMDNAYDAILRQEFLQIGKELNIPIHEGVYLATLGPSYETPSEVRLFQAFDADIVGMSTIPEVLVARHCGLKVVALSNITNMAAGLSDEILTHEAVLESAQAAPEKIVTLIQAFLKKRALAKSAPLVSQKSLPQEKPLAAETFKIDLNVTAKRLWPLIDLTSLNSDDTDERIATLCHHAANGRGHVAAVCIFPKFVKLAKHLLRDTPVRVASVVNFPNGTDELAKVTSDIRHIIGDGADEIDIVWPYEAYLSGQESFAFNFIRTCKQTCTDQILLQVILETGKLIDSAAIYQAARLVITAGADFVKTSTGKLKTGATPEAAAAILLAIKDSEKRVGFKAAGGISTVAQAAQYLALAEYLMGPQWISSKTFRIGSSKLLNDIIAHLDPKEKES